MGVTLQNLCDTVFLRVNAGVQNKFVQLAANVSSATAGDIDSVTLTGAQVQGVTAGSRLSVGLEIMLVVSWTSSDSVASVVRGYNGSTPSTHSTGAIVYLNPEFTYSDIARAINDDLADLSASGLYRVNDVAFPYIPVFMGYDLGAISSNFTDIISIRFAEANPARRFPAITSWEVVRDLSDPRFPSGQGIILYQSGFPGMNMYLRYAAPFLPLVNLTDDVTNTPTANDPAPPYNGWTVETVSNLPPTATDIPVLGALMRLTQPREIQRNDMGNQPEPRKAAEVPPGAVSASVNALMVQRQLRINAEAKRLAKQHVHRIR